MNDNVTAFFKRRKERLWSKKDLNNKWSLFKKVNKEEDVIKKKSDGIKGTYEKYSDWKRIKFTEKKTESKISIDKIKELIKQGKVPKGFYVSGRASRHNVSEDTGIWQSTNNWDVADQYGKGGDVIIFKPKKEAKTIDLKNKETRKKIINQLENDYHNGMTDDFSHIFGEINKNYKNDSDYEGEQGKEKIIRSLFPDDIVSSAEFFDDPELVDWIDRKYNYDLFTFGEDASVVMNQEKMDITRIPHELVKDLF